MPLAYQNHTEKILLTEKIRPKNFFEDVKYVHGLFAYRTSPLSRPPTGWVGVTPQVNEWANFGLNRLSALNRTTPNQLLG